MSKGKKDAITDVEIILTLENSNKVKVTLTKEDKKMFIGLLFNMFKTGLDTIEITDKEIES